MNKNITVIASLMVAIVSFGGTITVGDIPASFTDASVTRVDNGDNTVTLTALGEAFTRWYGKIPEGINPTERTITVSCEGDENNVIYPYYKKNWNFADGFMTDGYWKIPASYNAYYESFSINRDSQVLLDEVTLSCPLLDLDKPIIGADGVHYVNDIGRDTFSYGPTRCNAYIEYVMLPNTIKSIARNFFSNQIKLKKIEPLFPQSMTSNPADKNGCLLNVFLKGVGETTVIDLTCPGFTDIQSQCFKSTMGETTIDTILVGATITTIANCAFSYSNSPENTRASFTFKFFGNLPTFNGLFVQSRENVAENGQRVLADEENSTWASVFETARANPLTEEQEADYIARYPKGNLASVIGMATLGNCACYIESFPIHDKKVLLIEGSDGVVAAADEIDYGILSAQAGEQISLTAPQFGIFENAKYSCAGYELYQSKADGTWEFLASNSSLTATFVFPSEGSLKLVWKWEQEKIQLALAPTLDGTSISIDPSMPNNLYAPGSVVTLTANGDNFVRWYGNVSEDMVTNRTITLTLNGITEINPYFRKAWVYESGKISDGYWNIECFVTNGNEIVVGRLYRNKYWQPAHTYANEELANYPSVAIDLAKPIEGGYEIVTLSDNALNGTENGTSPNKVTEIFLPSTLRSIGRDVVRFQRDLINIEPLLPKSLTNVVAQTFMSLFCNEGAKKRTVDLSSKGLKSIPRQFFAMEQKGMVNEFIFGENIEYIGGSFFDGPADFITLRFRGNYPIFDGDPLSWNVNNNNIRVFIPHNDSTWSTFRSECTLPTAKELSNYRAVWTSPEDEEYLSSLVGIHTFGENKKAYVFTWKAKPSGFYIILR